MELQWLSGRPSKFCFHPLQPTDHLHVLKLGSCYGRMFLRRYRVVGALEQSCEAPMTVRGERAHSELLRETKCTAVVRFCQRNSVTLCRHFAEQPKGIRLVSALLVIAGELESDCRDRRCVANAAGK